MEEKLLEGYKKLSVIEKRKVINVELIRLFDTLNNLCKKNEFNEIKEKIQRFNDKDILNLTENDYLDQTYNDLMLLRKVIVNYFSWKE